MHLSSGLILIILLADLMELSSAFSFSVKNTVVDLYLKTKSLPPLRQQLLKSFSNFRQSPIGDTLRTQASSGNPAKLTGSIYLRFNHLHNLSQKL